MNPYTIQRLAEEQATSSTDAVRLLGAKATPDSDACLTAAAEACSRIVHALQRG